MKAVEVTRNINATASRVWSVLIDPCALVDADTGIARIDGQFSQGESFVLRADIAARDFKITVANFEPEHRMVWQSGMPLGLFRGVRQFLLRANEVGTCFTMREEFSGLLLPLIWKSMPDLQPSFDQFADALKNLSEKQPSEKKQ